MIFVSMIELTDRKFENFLILCLIFYLFDIIRLISWFLWTKVKLFKLVSCSSRAYSFKNVVKNYKVNKLQILAIYDKIKNDI